MWLWRVVPCYRKRHKNTHVALTLVFRFLVCSIFGDFDGQPGGCFPATGFRPGERLVDALRPDGFAREVTR